MIRTGISSKCQLSPSHPPASSTITYQVVSFPTPTTTFLLTRQLFHLRHHISIVLLPPLHFYRLPPPLRFYRFTTTTTFLSFYHHHYISIVSPSPLHFYRFTTTTTFLSCHHHHYISIVLPPPLHTKVTNVWALC